MAALYEVRCNCGAKLRLDDWKKVEKVELEVLLFWNLLNPFGPWLYLNFLDCLRIHSNILEVMR
jgi:hypothetical protein